MQVPNFHAIHFILALYYNNALKRKSFNYWKIRHLKKQYTYFVIKNVQTMIQNRILKNSFNTWRMMAQRQPLLRKAYKKVIRRTLLKVRK